MSPYRYIEHTADAGIEAAGVSLAEAFASAGEGLAAMLCEPETVLERCDVAIAVSSENIESLLVDWLSEINYRFEVDRFAFRRFTVHEISDERVAAVGHGEPLDLSRHRVGGQVKAVTYHELEVRRGGDGVSLRVILDL